MRKNPASTSISAQRPKPAVGGELVHGGRAQDGAERGGVGRRHRRREAVQDAEAVHEAFRLVTGGGEPVGDLLVGDDDGAAPGQRPAPGQQCVDGLGDVVQGLEDDHGVERAVVGDGRRRRASKVTSTPAAAAWRRASSIDAVSSSKPTMSACGYAAARAMVDHPCPHPTSAIRAPGPALRRRGPISVASSQSASAVV